PGGVQFHLSEWPAAAMRAASGSGATAGAGAGGSSARAGEAATRTPNTAREADVRNQVIFIVSLIGIVRTTPIRRPLGGRDSGFAPKPGLALRDPRFAV